MPVDPRFLVAMNEWLVFHLGLSLKFVNDSLRGLVYTNLIFSVFYNTYPAIKF